VLLNLKLTQSISDNLTILHKGIVPQTLFEESL
jgi:hypothetical protein